LFTSPNAKRLLVAAVSEWRPDLAVVQMVRCGWALETIRALRPGLPLIFDAIDCMALHYRRAAEHVSLMVRPAHRLEASRCQRREQELVESAWLTTAVSRRDLEALAPGEKGRVVPVAAGTVPIREKRSAGPPTVLMSGNLGYRPTVNAVRWFSHRVWPGLRGRVPPVRWILAGARPARSIRRLASVPGVEVHGDVADLGKYLRRASVAIAPMTIGSGVPIKILEAMAAGVPVVANPWSAQGLEDATGVAVADDENQWIDVIEQILRGGAFAEAQADRGFKVWREHYEPGHVAGRIRDVVESVAAVAT
jgi:hypothetical protein